MFRIYLVNFGYFAHNDCATLDLAKIEAKRINFESVIYRDNAMVATYHPLNGFKTL